MRLAGGSADVPGREVYLSGISLLLAAMVPMARFRRARAPARHEAMPTRGRPAGPFGATRA